VADETEKRSVLPSCVTVRAPPRLVCIQGTLRTGKENGEARRNEGLGTNHVGAEFRDTCEWPIPLLNHSWNGTQCVGPLQISHVQIEPEICPD
jgi:hypothetical protein